MVDGCSCCFAEFSVRSDVQHAEPFTYICIDRKCAPGVMGALNTVVSSPPPPLLGTDVCGPNYNNAAHVQTSAIISHYQSIWHLL